MREFVMFDMIDDRAHDTHARVYTFQSLMIQIMGKDSKKKKRKEKC
jgi:hypothetical protein